MPNPYGDYDFDTVHNVQLSGHQLLDLRLAIMDAESLWRAKEEKDPGKYQWAIAEMQKLYRFVHSISPTKQFGNLSEDWYAPYKKDPDMDLIRQDQALARLED